MSRQRELSCLKEKVIDELQKGVNFQKQARHQNTRDVFQEELPNTK